MNEPTHLDLFSGIGGFSIAFERAGFRTIGFAEIDPYASAVLRKHWPGVTNYGDVRNVPAIACDVLTGGFPCHPFSSAGRKLGEKDDRYLWPAMLAAISRCRPTWVVGENVTNIANMVLSRCLDDLGSIGYQSIPFDISAAACGLPTMERHVWIIATLSSNELEGDSKEIFQGPARLAKWNPCSASDEALQRLRDLPEPALYRSRKGVPGYVDRIRCLGNAIPPSVAEVIARNIKAVMDAENQFTGRTVSVPLRWGSNAIQSGPPFSIGDKPGTKPTISRSERDGGVA